MLRSLIVSAAAIALLAVAGSAQATTFIFAAPLLGASEVPPNASPGTGFATVTVDDVLDTMLVDITFSGLIGTTTASHIHCCTAVPGAGNAGVATELPLFTGFPVGVHSGSYLHSFDLLQASTYNPAFVAANGGTPTSAEAALLAGMGAGESYLNVHSSFAPGGEIRALLVAVPEPATWALMIAGFGLAGATLRRRRTAPA